jgi:hypothetical protein
LRGVGENLRDHYSPRMKWAVPHALRMTYNTRTCGLGMAWQALRYATTRKGLLGLPAAPIRAYIRTRPGLEAPDAAISWIPFLVGDNFQLAKDSGVAVVEGEHHRAWRFDPRRGVRRSRRAPALQSVDPVRRTVARFRYAPDHDR